ncbi:MAG: hypothetical protein WBA07_32180 [Rivularia sp. (in: cyanobacteria)]
MAQTTGLARGGFAIDKIFIDFNRLQKDVKENTNSTTLDARKDRGRLYFLPNDRSKF